MRRFAFTRGIFDWLAKQYWWVILILTIVFIILSPILIVVLTAIIIVEFILVLLTIQREPKDKKIYIREVKTTVVAPTKK